MGMLLAMTRAKQLEEALNKAEIPFADESALIPEEEPKEEQKPVKTAKKPVKKATANRKRTSK